jgi:hypothetical protein
MLHTEAPSDSMRARLEAELRAMDEYGDKREPSDSRPGGTFSLGLIALASWLGVGFGGVVLTTLNDWRLGNRPVWRSAALFFVVLLGSVAVLSLVAPSGLTPGLSRLVKMAVNIGGPTLVAFLLQNSQLTTTPREARPVRYVLGAIVIGWPLTLAFWIPLTLLLVP